MLQLGFRTGTVRVGPSDTVPVPTDTVPVQVLHTHRTCSLGFCTGTLRVGLSDTAPVFCGIFVDLQFCHYILYVI
jgi:hypothetical protein